MHNIDPHKIIYKFDKVVWGIFIQGCVFFTIKSAHLINFFTKYFTNTWNKFLIRIILWECNIYCYEDITCTLWLSIETCNVNEIEGLLFPGLGQMKACKLFKWRTGSSHQVTSWAHSKIFNWKSSILSTLVTSLDGKNLRACVCPNPENSKPETCMFRLDTGFFTIMLLIFFT